ncbi:hypothetical protein AVEN_91941-1, partial [Araneus ventricosus]
VAWTDESRFLIHHVDDRVKVRRLPGEQLIPSCTASHAQAGGGGIMLWGTFSWAALGPAVVVEQTMKAEDHCGSFAPIHGVCLPNWKWDLPAGQRSLSQGSDCVGVVRGAY